MAWLPDGDKISKIFLVVLVQLTNVTDGRTDGQTDGHRMPAIAALCIASHGKNLKNCGLQVTTLIEAFEGLRAPEPEKALLYTAVGYS